MVTRTTFVLKLSKYLIAYFLFQFFCICIFIIHSSHWSTQW